MSNKVDFEAPDYDSPDVILEDARIDAIEQDVDLQKHAAEIRAFEQQVLSYAVTSCLDSCLSCLDLLYVTREANPISDIAVAHDSWRQEAEPEPCSRDSWLRGAIPETSAPARASIQPALSLGTKDRPQSGLAVRRGGPKSVASTAADGDQTQRRPTLSADSRGRASAAVPAVIQAAAPAASKPQAEPAVRASHSSSKHANKQLSPEHQEAEARLRQELQLRRQQEAVAKELKQKDEQARAALLSMQKDLKGKDYTYDSSGKLVLLNSIKPESLPAQPGPQFKVHTTAAAAGDTAANSKPAKSSTGSSSALSATSSKAKSSKKLTAGNTSNDFVQTASVTQPPVLETLRPAAGVTLRAGAAAKQGPKREVAGQTRTQYQQQAKAKNQQAARVARPAAPGAANRSSMTGSTGPTGLSTSSSIRRSIAGTTATAATTTGRPSSSSQLTSAAAAAATGTSSRPSIAGALRPAPAAAAAAAAMPKRPPSADVNLALVAAADWGTAANSGYVPPDSPDIQRPDEKQIKEEFGRTTYLPKSRAPVATLKPPSAQPASTINAKQLGQQQR